MDFKYEEDMEAAVNLAESILGKQGRMLESGKNVQHNVRIEGPRATILWYGDLDMVADAGKISLLAQKLGVTPSVMKEGRNIGGSQLLRG
jgi:hypothetical protein